MPGNTHPRRSKSPCQRLTNPLRRCAERCQVFRQTYIFSNLFPLLLPPDRRIRPFPPSQSDTRGRRTFLPSPYWSTRWPFSSLSILQIAQPLTQAEEGRDTHKEVEIYLVWNCGVVSTACAGVEHVFLAHNCSGKCALGGQVRRTKGHCCAGCRRITCRA